MPPAVPKRSANHIALLACLCGCVSLILYLLIPGALVTIPSTVPTHAGELFPWVKPFSVDSLRALSANASLVWPHVSVLALYAGLFGAYAFMVRLMKGEQSFAVRAIVFGGGVIFLASFLVSPVMLSTDTYAYGYYGRLVSHYGKDAYAANPGVSMSDPFLAGFGHTTPTIYGPLWTAISAGVTWVGGDRVGFTLFLFRGLAAVSVLLGTGLIWSILRRLAPERALQGAAFFLWNPLVITETALSGHNDAAMILFVLLAIWLHVVQGHRAGAVAALTFSALVKFVAGPLALLYMLMVARESKNWKERMSFALRAVLAAGIAIAVVYPLAHKKSGGSTSSYATAPDFYSNNYHELIFKGLRYSFGEDAERVHVPIYFANWWVKANEPLELRAAHDLNAPVKLQLKQGARLLAMAPQTDDVWLRVYDPPSRQLGYISARGATPVDPLPVSETDPVAHQLETGTMTWPTVIKANNIVRVVTYGLFAAFGLLAAWRTTGFARFLAWAPMVMLAMYFTITTQIWPWYLIWALALGALTPGSSASKLAALLSAGMITLYCTISFEGNVFYSWINYYRSIPAIVIPTLGFAVYWVWKKGANRKLSLGVRVQSGSQKLG